MVLPAACVFMLVRRTTTATALALLAVIVELTTGTLDSKPVVEAVVEIAPLLAFLTAAIWLAELADGAGLTARIGASIARTSGGRRSTVYATTCAACALLTMAVSLDGAVVLMVPLVLTLADGDRGLSRALLLATVVVANACSLAVPQGNPTNIVVMDRLGLSPSTFVAHLFVPAVVATALCAGALAIVERRALRGHFTTERPTRPAPSTDEKIAIGALVVATIGGVASPWLGVAPWAPLPAVAALTCAGLLVLGRPRPAIHAPWRISFQLLALLVGVGAVATRFAPRLPEVTSLSGALGLALCVAALTAAANNLPASALVGGLLGPRPLPAAAALIGLTVGSLTTRHGSVATLIAFDRVEHESRELARGGYLRILLPLGVVATIAATTAAWLTTRLA